MGRVGFTTENKGKVTNFDFPKLKLTKDERARVIVGLEDPAMEYVHTLRKPKIEDGQPVTVQVKNDKTGAITTEFDKVFVGNPICLGDASIIADKGLDPKNCPACALAKENPEFTDPPKRRFAMHVIRYRTKAGGFQLAKPESVEMLVWAFGDMVFNKIVEAQEEWKDIRKHDFLLGPCTNPGFQKFDINVGAEAAWLNNEDLKRIVVETFREQQIPDLTVAIGRTIQPAWMQADAEGIKEAWAQVKAAKNGESGSTSTLGDDLNGLLGKDSKDDEGWVTPEAAAEAEDLLGGTATPASSLKAQAADATPTDGDDMFGDLLGSTSAPAAEEAPVEEEPAAPAPKATKAEAKPATEKPDNFDDLLASV